MCDSIMAPVLPSVVPARNWSTGRFGRRMGKTAEKPPKPLDVRRRTSKQLGCSPFYRKVNCNNWSRALPPVGKSQDRSTAAQKTAEANKADRQQIDESKVLFLGILALAFFRNFHNSSVDKAHNFKHSYLTVRLFAQTCVVLASRFGVATAAFAACYYCRG
jgi:hypothetical protein